MALGVKGTGFGLHKEPRLVRVEGADVDTAVLAGDGVGGADHVEQEVPTIGKELRPAVGDVEVKRKLALAINEFLEPMRERRAQYEARLAERQYQAVDPENRLVAAELERRIEEAEGRDDPDAVRKLAEERQMLAQERSLLRHRPQSRQGDASGDA